MDSINQSIQNYDDSLEKSKTVYSGILGLAIGGSRKVNIETRAGYVYVRLRDNLSEVIQAYNDKVSPVYDFPVLIERRGNKWYITGRDDQRYETFGTASPFLPQHGDVHSFNRDGGGGGDAVFVYPDQFVPLLVYPSGTFGAGNLMVAPYSLQRTSDFIYVGNTGTQNLLVYKPTNAQAIVGLVYLDKTTGNPGVLIASGTPMSGTSTGTSSVLPYLPYPSSNQEPLYAFRLLSGTTALTWSNLYNVRQFYGGGSASTGSSGGISGIVVQDEGITQGTGTVLNFVGDNVSVSVSGTVARVFVTGSAGSSLPSFITGSVPFSGSDGLLKENNSLLNFDEANGTLWSGRKPPSNIAFGDFRFGARATGTNTSVAFGGLAAGTGTLGSPSMTYNGYRSRGTFDVPLPVQSGDALLTSIGNGFDGVSWRNAGRLRFYADGDWVTGSHTPTRMDIDITPSGSATRRTQFQVYGDSVNQPTGSTYNIGGAQHTHIIADVSVSNVNDFVLTLESGVPYPTIDQTAKTTLYCTPSGRGNAISLWDGAKYIVRNSAEFSISLSGLTANLPYDVFCYDNVGTPTLEMLAWSSTTARATALVDNSGVRSKSGVVTRRYLGTILITATTGQCEDSTIFRGVYNFYNQVNRDMGVIEGTGHQYNGAVRKWNNSDTNNLLTFIVGVVEGGFTGSVRGNATSVAAEYCFTYLYLNNVATTAYTLIYNTITGFAAGNSVSMKPALGKNILQVYEYANNVGGGYSSMEMNANIRM